MSNQWNHGLFNCFTNLSVCLMASFLPCITIANNAELSNTCVFITACLASVFLPCLNLWIMAKSRQNTRELYDISGSFVNDCLVSLFCPCCSIIQVKNQLDSSHMGMSIQRIQTNFEEHQARVYIHLSLSSNLVIASKF